MWKLLTNAKTALAIYERLTKGPNVTDFISCVYIECISSTVHRGSRPSWDARLGASARF